MFRAYFWICAQGLSAVPMTELGLIVHETITLLTVRSPQSEISIGAVLKYHYYKENTNYNNNHTNTK